MTGGVAGRRQRVSPAQSPSPRAAAGAGWPEVGAAAGVVACASRTCRPGQGWRRKNRSGVAKMRRGVAYRVGDRNASEPRHHSCSERLCLPPPLRNAHLPDLLPPATPPAPAGRRRHGFPRSHGPSKREVNGSWLRLRCRGDANPPSHTTCNDCRPRAARRRNAEGAREPQKSWDSGRSGLEDRRGAPRRRASSLARPSPRLGVRSPRARRCTSPPLSDGGCSRWWDSSPRWPRPAAA